MPNNRLPPAMQPRRRSHKKYFEKMGQPEPNRRTGGDSKEPKDAKNKKDKKEKKVKTNRRGMWSWYKRTQTSSQEQENSGAKMATVPRGSKPFHEKSAYFKLQGHVLPWYFLNRETLRFIYFICELF